MSIRLGTEGWRGILGRDFTIANTRLFAQAAADWVVMSGAAEAGTVVGYDTRFMSETFAREAAEVLAGSGIPVFLATHPVTTPVLSFTVRNLGAAAGLMVTASHNPPQYNGIKLKGPHGGPVFGETLTAIESRLGSAEPLYRGAAAPVHLIDPDVKYLSHVAGLVDLAAIRDARLNIVVDCMHGAGRMYLRRILQKADIRIRQLHGKPDPTFGGVNPEPLEANLAALKRAVAAFGADVGLATDGDGDRLGAFDHRGRFVNPHEVFALILSYLVEKKGLRGGVAKTFSTTRMIDRLAQAYDLPVYETPVGFKHISELFLAEDILVGGEESGGLGVKGHLPERDGIVTALLLLEAMARQGKSLATLIAELFAKVGPHHYRRLDIHLSAGPRTDSPGPVPRTPPPGFSLAGHQVTGVSTLDGTKYQLGEAGWILFRSSGTEPVVRVYVEAATEEDVDAILSDGARLVRSAF